MTGAGDLRHRIAFEKRDAGDDGMGNVREGWTEQFRCAASRIPMKGGEEVMAARLESRQPFIVRVRQSTNTLRIRASWRARDARAGTIYNIRTISDPDGRGTWLDLLVEQGVADG